jgi:hypothetical protein
MSKHWSLSKILSNKVVGNAHSEGRYYADF